MQTLTSEEQLRLRDNLARVRERIAAAAREAGRDPARVRLIAVTKQAPLHWVRALAAEGQVDFGESRPENVPLRAEALWLSGTAARWHVIGPFQRRKVERTLDFCHVVHSVASEKLLASLARRRAATLERLLAMNAGDLRPPAGVPEQAPAPERQRELLAAAAEASLAGPFPLLLQVNVSGEASKQGLAGPEVGPLLEGARGLFPLLEVRGLMTMAPLGWPSGRLRGVFRDLRELRDGLARRGPPLPELSMGMSRDFEEAVAEGATMVRVGTALYEGLRRERHPHLAGSDDGVDS